MEYLSERVSVERKDGRTSVVISARLSRGKETLLVTWFSGLAAVWCLCHVRTNAAVRRRSRPSVPAGLPGLLDLLRGRGGQGRCCGA